MSQETTGDDPLERAAKRLREAETSDHDDRLETLNEVHETLERVLDEQAPPPGR